MRVVGVDMLRSGKFPILTKFEKDKAGEYKEFFKAEGYLEIRKSCCGRIRRWVGVSCKKRTSTKRVWDVSNLQRMMKRECVRCYTRRPSHFVARYGKMESMSEKYLLKLKTVERMNDV